MIWLYIAKIVGISIPNSTAGRERGLPVSPDTYFRKLISVISDDHCAVCIEITQFMQSDFFSSDLLPGEASLSSKA